MYNSAPASKSNTAFVYNPELFDPTHYLPPQLRHLGDWARLLLDIIGRRHLAVEAEDTDFVCLHSKIIEKQIDPHIYYPVRNALVDAGVIEVNHSYAVNSHSKGFRFTDAFIKERTTRVALHSEPVIKKLKKNKAKYQVVLKCAEHERLWHWLQQVEVDYDSASDYLKGLKLEDRRRRRRELDLMHLRDKDYYCKPDLQGRVHNNVVNMASNLRKFISISKTNLVCLDIANAQPLFFCILLINQLKSCSYHPYSFSLHNVLEKRTIGVYYQLLDVRSKLPQDMQDFITLCEQGRLYAYLMEMMNIKPKPYVFKRKFFEQVFYCQLSDYPAKMRVAFKKLFPNVQIVINELKAHDYKNAPLMMQRMEAQFVIHTVCKRLFAEQPEAPILTIHDSIMTTPQYKETVAQVIKEEFMKVGLKVTLR